MSSFGETLRNAREAKGLTCSQVASQTHMLVQIVEEMEREDFHRIPAPIYGRGFVRLFAECVGPAAPPRSASVKFPRPLCHPPSNPSGNPRPDQRPHPSQSRNPSPNRNLRLNRNLSPNRSPNPSPNRSLNRHPSPNQSRNRHPSRHLNPSRLPNRRRSSAVWISLNRPPTVLPRTNNRCSARRVPRSRRRGRRKTCRLQLTFLRL